MRGNAPLELVRMGFGGAVFCVFCKNMENIFALKRMKKCQKIL